MKAILALLFLSSVAHAQIDFCDYEASTGKFIVRDNGSIRRQSVDSGFFQANVACSDEYAALYDGDDFYVYDAYKEQFVRTMMPNDNAQHSAISTGNNGVLFYDGDDLFSYCGGEFNRTFSVDDNARARPFNHGLKAAMQIGEYFFFLDSQCEFVKNHIDSLR